MKLIINKRKILRYLLILLLVLLSVGILYFLLFINNKETSAYERLFKHCTEEIRGTKKCNVFLSGYREDNNSTCLEIVLPEIEPDKRDIEICLEGNTDWENPYEDYSLNVPVVLTMYYDSTILRKDAPEKIDIELMDDEIVYELLEDIYFSGEDVILVRTQSANENQKKGYTYYQKWEPEEEDRYMILGLIDVEIESLKKKGDEIEMEINFKMDDKEFTHVFTTENISLLISKTSEGFDLTTEDELDEYFDLDDRYGVSFSLFDLEKEILIPSDYEGLHNQVLEDFGGIDDSFEFRLESITK